MFVPVLSVQPGIGVAVIVAEAVVPKLGPAPKLPPGRLNPAKSPTPLSEVQIV